MICDFFNENLEYQENLLAKYYIKYGHEVVIVTSTLLSVFDYYEEKIDNSLLSKKYMHQGIMIYRLQYRWNLLNKVKMYKNLAPILEQEKPDLIFMHDILPNILNVVSYKKKYPLCKIILDYHADYSNSGNNWLSINVLHKIIRKFFLYRLKPYLSNIFPIVPAGAKFLHELYGIDYSEMEILPLGADVDLAKNIQTSFDKIKLRQELGIGQAAKVIFAGGKFDPLKKIELLIDAVNIINNSNVHLCIVGDASENHQEYKSLLINKANNNPNIHFLGWLSNKEVFKYLHICDFAVFPASQSILWQQAISMGLPLIVGNTGHQDSSYLNKYNNMIILDNCDININKLVLYITKLVNDSDLLQAMSLGANNVRDEILDWNIIVQKTLVCCVE